MPGGDGLEATRRIQQLDPAPAVIVITTFDMDEYVFGALEAGACGILLKDSSITRSEEHSLNSSHRRISYAVFCLKKKNTRR